MPVFLKRATGRAVCGVCRQKIAKGQATIVVRGRHTVRHFHSESDDCIPRGVANIEAQGCHNCGEVDCSTFGLDDYKSEFCPNCLAIKIIGGDSND